jgi:hypothetical protein
MVEQIRSSFRFVTSAWMVEFRSDQFELVRRYTGFITVSSLFLPIILSYRQLHARYSGG